MRMIFSIYKKEYTKHEKCTSRVDVAYVFQCLKERRNFLATSNNSKRLPLLILYFSVEKNCIKLSKNFIQSTFVFSRVHICSQQFAFFQTYFFILKQNQFFKKTSTSSFLFNKLRNQAENFDQEFKTIQTLFRFIKIEQISI